MDIKLHKAFKYRIYPTPKQKEFFARSFGCCRKIWNLMLSDKNYFLKSDGMMLNLTPAMYKNDYPYLKEVDSLALTNVQLDLENAFARYFKHEGGYPNYKAKHHTRCSYTTNNQNTKSGPTIIVGPGYVKLPKIGKVEARVHNYAPKDYKLKNATISKEKDNSFYVSVQYEYIRDMDINLPDTFVASKKYDIAGFDYKSDGLFVSSDGTIPGMPKFLRKSEKRLTKEQRKLSRMIESHIVRYKKGPKGGRIPVYDKPLEECKNIQKQKHKIAKIHRHIANERKDFLQKLSTEIANRYDVVVVETLNMRAMANKGFGNGKATMDNGYGIFLVMLEQKLRERGKPFIKVDKWYPSSQLCSNCGGKQKMPLNVRTYRCPKCGMVMDRDLNAAKNIKAEGIRMLTEGLWSYEDFLKNESKKSKAIRQTKTAKATAKAA